MAFFQDGPRLSGAVDPFLAELLDRTLPPDVRASIEPALRELASEAPRFAERSRLERLDEPRLISWSPWGKREDHIELSALWRDAKELSAVHGLVATAYERRHGPHARVHQFALNYVVQASLDFYSCPLAMTDGAARTLLDAGNEALIARAVPHLISRDPASMWTSGQWMTERTGGSDVGLSETRAVNGDDGWRLFGTKWFTSATTSEMALTLARPEGAVAGGRGLALFYVETRDAHGRMNQIAIHRLKDKLGTRKVPTAELALEGARAILVGEEQNGVRAITPMLNVTRTWNAMGAAWLMRRAVDLARDYATRRVQFGATLAMKPLHQDTLAGLEAEARAGLVLAMRGVALLGALEARTATDDEKRLLRIVIPLAKLTTGKQAVAVTSEVLECFGGAGYVEDTGLPQLLRDAQVLPIWEGTTNVLSLDVLRAMARERALEALGDDVMARLARVTATSLARPVEAARQAFAHAKVWLDASLAHPTTLESGARRLALTLGRATALSLLCEHAQWALEQGKGEQGAAAARRFAHNGVDLVADLDEPLTADAALLLG
jgi:alkylation response protein AidB-like acyl-CoA dehydrogenase